VLAEIAVGPHRPAIVRGRCSERLNGAEAYLPILEVLDSLLHGQTVGRSTDMMKTLAPTWYVHVGMLSAESTSAQQLREDTKIASPERMKRELAALLKVFPRRLCCSDDPEWLTFRRWTSEPPGQRFAICAFVLVTYRSSEMVLEASVPAGEQSCRRGSSRNSLFLAQPDVGGTRLSSRPRFAGALGG
jgi:hypothetical protein